MSQTIFCEIHDIPMSIMDGVATCTVCEDIRKEEEAATKFDERREEIHDTQAEISATGNDKN